MRLNFFRPATYIPRVEVQVTELVKASVLKPLQALKLRAKKDFVRDGVHVTTGQEYLYKRDGAYLPEVTEEVVEIINATILTEKKALHLRAKGNKIRPFFGLHSTTSFVVVDISCSNSFLRIFQRSIW